MKEMNIENRSYEFFDDMIDIRNFNLDSLKIDKKSYKKLIFITLDISQRKILNV